MFRLLIPLAILWLGLSLNPLASEEAPAPVMTWMVMSQTGRQRETVPPVVLYIDAEGRKQAQGFAAKTSWAAQIGPEEMAKIMPQLDRKPAKDATGRSFQVVFGNPKGKAASFALTEPTAKAFALKLRGDLLISKDAIRAVQDFGKTFGW